MTVSHHLLVSAATAVPPCRLFNPLVSTIYGPSKHCRDCGKLESEHPVFDRIAIQKERYAKRLRYPDLENTQGI
jgi:hypothetical protein